MTEMVGTDTSTIGHEGSSRKDDSMPDLAENQVALIAVLATLVVAIISAVASVSNLFLERRHVATNYTRDNLRPVIVDWFRTSFEMQRLCFHLADRRREGGADLEPDRVETSAETFLELSRLQMDRLTQIRLLAPRAVLIAQEEVYHCHLMAAWAGIEPPYRWRAAAPQGAESENSLRDTARSRRQALFAAARREMSLPGRRKAPWESPNLPGTGQRDRHSS